MHGAMILGAASAVDMVGIQMRGTRGTSNADHFEQKMSCPFRAMPLKRRSIPRAVPWAGLFNAFSVEDFIDADKLAIDVETPFSKLALARPV